MRNPLREEGATQTTAEVALAPPDPCSDCTDNDGAEPGMNLRDLLREFAGLDRGARNVALALGAYGRLER